MPLFTWLVGLLFSVAPPTSTYTGFWLTGDQDAVVEISRQGDRCVGRYVAFRKDPASAGQQARLNYYVLKDLKPDDHDLTGKVLDPNTGKEYKATLHLASPQTLELRVKVMGMTAHTETWTRQPSGK